jgi:aspartate-semialdehyde dehydrogenase
MAISAQCNRVNTVEGHLEAVSVRLARKAEVDAVVEALQSFTALPQELELPSAPRRPIVVRDNTVRGAAGGSILNAELLVAKGYLRI